MPEVRVNDARLHFEEDGEGAPVVFLHGALGIGMAFRGQRAALRDMGRLIFLDQRGHGKSAHFGAEIEWDTFTYDQLVADAREFIDIVSPGAPVHLVGVSMGGLVAARVAAAAPHRVASLALISAAARASEKRREYFTTTPVEATLIARFGALWHGEPYWRALAREMFTRIAAATDVVYPDRIDVPRTLIVQAEDDELLEEDEPALWASRMRGEVVVERAPGTHAFFADGRAGTKAVNEALRRHLKGGQGGLPPRSTIHAPRDAGG